MVIYYDLVAFKYMHDEPYTLRDEAGRNIVINKGDIIVLKEGIRARQLAYKENLFKRVPMPELISESKTTLSPKELAEQESLKGVEETKEQVKGEVKEQIKDEVKEVKPKRGRKPQQQPLKLQEEQGIKENSLISQEIKEEVSLNPQDKQEVSKIDESKEQESLKSQEEQGVKEELPKKEQQALGLIH